MNYNITNSQDFRVLSSQILGYMGGVIVTILNIPQIVKLYKTKSSKDLSILTLILNLFCSFIFLGYGYLINQLPILITNVFYLIISTILITMKCYYDKKNLQ